MTSELASWSGAASEFVIVVHGGAGTRAPDEACDEVTGCRAAALAGAAVLQAGGSALDAVERAVVVLEDDPRYNAGFGAALNADGDVELDAAIMDGKGLGAGAVASLRGFANPIRVARAVLDDGRHVLFAADGAAAFAAAHGFAAIDPRELVTQRACERLARFVADGRERQGNTVGAVARDAKGTVAAATSTGGIVGKRRGRIGDSPILGAGTYADDAVGAVSATGHGEGILRVALASRVLATMQTGVAPAAAARDTLAFMRTRVGSSGGLIVVDAHGNVAVARSTNSMPWTAIDARGELGAGE
jgi:beta-aspartyl-peptidase (threonine type)